MHHNDKVFLEKAAGLFNISKYKTSETKRRIRCIIENPPKTDIDTIRQIQLMKPCKMSFNVRERELYFEFYKEGEIPSRKRPRETVPVKHPFDVKVHPNDQKVIDTILNLLCSLPNLCVFTVDVHKSDHYDLQVSNIEAVPYTIVDKITSSLSTFVSNTTFDFPNQRIHFSVKRNDNL